MIKVKDEPNLVRNENGVIQNVCADDYRVYVAQRASKIQLQKRIESLEKDTTEIKNTLSQILNLLQDDRK